MGNWYRLLVPTASVFFNASHSMKSRSLLCLTFVPDTPTNNHSSQSSKWIFSMVFHRYASRACLCKSNTLNACDVNKFFCFLTCCQRKDELSLASIILPELFQMVLSVTLCEQNQVKTMLHNNSLELSTNTFIEINIYNDEGKC